MTLTQLRYLVAISDAQLNITVAAQRMHATQPGLSKQLKQLEDELGVLLFIRKGRSLKAVTPAGKDVIERARMILAETSNIQSYAANQRQERQGQLVITTTHTQAKFVLPPVVAHITKTYPNVGVHLLQATESDALDLLENKCADIALVSTVEKPPSAGVALPLYRWRRHVIASSSHPLSRIQHSPDLSQLSNYPLISYDSSTRVNSSLQRAFIAAGLKLRLAITALDADLIKTYVQANLGVGIVAEMALDRNNAQLCHWPAPAEIPECICWAVLPRDKVIRNYTSELLTTLIPSLKSVDTRSILEEPVASALPPPEWIVFLEQMTRNCSQHHAEESTCCN